MNGTSNATDIWLISYVGRNVAVVLYSVCAMLILVCNAFTLYILHTCQNAFQENTRLFFKALAIVDMCGGLFGAFLDLFLILPIVSEYMFLISGNFCTFLPPLYYLFFNQTLAILCCINLDRLLTIILPLRYPILVTTKRAKRVLFFALIIPLLFTVFLWPIPGFPATEIYWMLCGLNGSHEESNNQVNFKYDLDITTEPSWSLMFVPVALTIMITTFSNICLMVISCRHIRKMKRNADQQRVNNQRNGQDIMKGVRTVLVITGSCYTGMGIWLFTLTYIFPKLELLYTAPFIISGVVELSTRWWNCLIYLSTSQTFREHAAKAIKRICRGRNNQLMI